MDSSSREKTRVLLSCQLRRARLSLVKMTPLFRNQRNIFTLRGILSFHNFLLSTKTSQRTISNFIPSLVLLKCFHPQSNFQFVSCSALFYLQDDLFLVPISYSKKDKFVKLYLESSGLSLLPLFSHAFFSYFTIAIVESINIYL